MKENVILDRTFNFAARIYKLHKYLLTEKKEYILAKQILRCGTSIGANMEEANGSPTKRDFINKVSIAYKEARETSYWLRLMNHVDLIEEPHFQSIHKDCQELINLLSSIILTAKDNLKKEQNLPGTRKISKAT